MNCPFCRSEIAHILESGSTKLPIYKCGTHWDLQTWVRTEECKDRQLSQQADLLERAMEVVKIVATAELYLTRNSKGEPLFTSIKINDSHLFILADAQALIKEWEDRK